MVDEPTGNEGAETPDEQDLGARAEALRSVEDALRSAEEALRAADAALPGAGARPVVAAAAASTAPGVAARSWSPAIAIAGAASLGAGAVHAAAIGAHAEHQQVVKVFTVLAVLQLVWGAAALVRPSRWLSSVGILLGGAAVVGWIMAKTSGVSFIDGMEVAESVQWSDGLCAALAAVAGIGAGIHLLVGAGAAISPSPSKRGTVALRRASFVGTIAIAALSLTGMNAAATHSHAGEGHSHGDETAAGHPHADEAAAGHSHAEGESASGADATTGSGDEGAGHDHGTPSAVAPVAYDPELPIDLGGVEGVTPQQQARAENLIAVTLDRLPQFSDVSTLEAKGYNSIHDGGTGYEHFINWSYINDGRELNPDFPESLVFEVRGGQKQLVSAMFMAEGGVDLDHVPDVGGALTQWHIHDNLCYTETDPPRVAGLTGSDGNCRPGTRKLGNPVPMIHVWIRSHKCGPFAALEGVAAGQVKAGETTLCDAAHGHTA